MRTLEATLEEIEYDDHHLKKHDTFQCKTAVKHALNEIAEYFFQKLSCTSGTIHSMSICRECWSLWYGER